MSNFIFLNLDVDLESTEPLDVIAEELGDSVVVMYVGEYDHSHRLSLELAGVVDSPDYLTECFVKLFSKLSTDATATLAMCTKIDFNFGFEGNSGNLANNLSKSSVASLSKLNASVSITLYSGN